MKLIELVSNIAKKVCEHLSKVDDDEYEPYRSEFEKTMAGKSLSRAQSGRYADNDVEQAWSSLCKSKTDEVLRLW